MSDIAIHIQVADGKREKVTVPSDMGTSEFLEELLEGLKLPSHGNGSGPGWRLIDPGTGRALPLKRTLEENGVQAGQDLILEAGQPDVELAPCPHCGFENPAKNKFCGKCGKPMEARLPRGDLRILVHTEDGKSSEVDVPSGFRVEELLVELLGAPVKGKWTVYDKDTGEDLVESQSLAENGVRNGHQIYLRKIPESGGLDSGKKGAAEKVKPTSSWSERNKWKSV